MEAPGFITLLYIVFTLPDQLGIRQLPRANWLMALLFVRIKAFLHDTFTNVASVDHSLCISSHHLPGLPEPIHGSNPPPRMDCCAGIPDY